jgi:uncharacterized protein
MARELGINDIQFIPVRNKELPKEEMIPLIKDKKYLIVDEICDTGNIYSKVCDAIRMVDCDRDFAFLMTRSQDDNDDERGYVGKVLDHNKWIVFPWE